MAIRYGKTKIATILGIAILVATSLVFVAAGPAGAVVSANANGEIQMLSPYQKIKFNVVSKSVQYWNYDYPDGAGTLNYTATIACSYVDKVGQEARFEFQIPDGHPGLSGLYVVVDVKILDPATKSYVYGHTATTDLPTATQWCQTGVGFSPTMYPVKSGVLYIK